MTWHTTYLGDDFGHGLLELLGGGLVQRCGRGRVGGHCSSLLMERLDGCDGTVLGDFPIFEIALVRKSMKCLFSL